MGKSKVRQPMSLPRVFVSGIAFSTALVGICFWLFASQAAGRKRFWLAGLDQDAYFSITRNAVTLAAALGVGVTLFFSYRKQQTAERAQDLALEAQSLATRTLELSLDKHGLDTISGLRDRYARSAEQLASQGTAVILAGIHSLVALAEDWRGAGNQHEQQVCISLLCSYMSSLEQQPALSAAAPMIQETAWRAISGRLKTEGPSGWSNMEIELTSMEMPAHALNGFRVQGGGRFSAVNVVWPSRGVIVSRLVLSSGRVLLRPRYAADLHLSPRFSYCKFEGGSFSLKSEVLAQSPVLFTGTDFTGSKFEIDLQGKAHLIFQRCTFQGGSIAIHVEHPVTVIFRNCIFEKDIVSVFGCTHEDLIVENDAPKFSKSATGMIRVGESVRESAMVQYGPAQSPLF